MSSREERLHMAQKEDLLVEGRTLGEELGVSRGEVTCQDKVINWGHTQGEPLNARLSCLNFTL